MTLTDQVPAGLRGADAFMVLGLPHSPDLTDEQVREAYLLRLRAVHPDNGGDTRAAAAVTAAYDALRSAGRRGELLTAIPADHDCDAPGDDAAGGWLRRRTGRARAGSPPPSQRDESARPGTGRVPDAARREELWRKMSAARVEQGLPPYITDEATLDKIADLLVATLDRDQAAPGQQARPVAADAARQYARLPPQLPSSGRGQQAAGRDQPGPGSGAARSWPVRGWLRVRHGRPGWLAARVVAAAAVVLVAQLTAPGDPAVWALGTGTVTWLVRAARFDLAPRARR